MSESYQPSPSRLLQLLLLLLLLLVRLIDLIFRSADLLAAGELGVDREFDLSDFLSERAECRSRDLLDSHNCL